MIGSVIEELLKTAAFSRFGARGGMGKGQSGIGPHGTCRGRGTPEPRIIATPDIQFEPIIPKAAKSKPDGRSRTPRRKRAMRPRAAPHDIRISADSIRILAMRPSGSQDGS